MLIEGIWRNFNILIYAITRKKFSFCIINCPSIFYFKQNNILQISSFLFRSMNDVCESFLMIDENLNML